MAAQSATPLLKVEGLKQYFKVNKNFTVKAVEVGNSEKTRDITR